MSELCLPCPGKLNLFLHVTGSRPDGYHLLQTLFRLLDHGDELTLAPAKDLTLEAPGCDVAPADNLVMRAARALREHAGITAGARMHLRKRLPAGGGVGGGSSDAATALLGLNRLWGLNLSLDTLAAIGLELGADVPVFVHGHTAFAEGVGERLTPVSLPREYFLILDPGVHVSTAQVFRSPELTRNTPESTVAAFLGAGPETQFRNDCEPVVRALFPEVDAALTWLQQHAGNARMSGTGACVFARFEQAQPARQLMERVPQQWHASVAAGRDHSPLHEALAQT